MYLHAMWTVNRAVRKYKMGPEAYYRNYPVITIRAQLKLILAIFFPQVQARLHLLIITPSSRSPLRNKCRFMGTRSSGCQQKISSHLLIFTEPLPGTSQKLHLRREHLSQQISREPTSETTPSKSCILRVARSCKEHDRKKQNKDSH